MLQVHDHVGVGPARVSLCFLRIGLFTRTLLHSFFCILLLPFFPSRSHDYPLSLSFYPLPLSPPHPHDERCRCSGAAFFWRYITSTSPRSLFASLYWISDQFSPLPLPPGSYNHTIYDFIIACSSSLSPLSLSPHTLLTTFLYRHRQPALCQCGKYVYSLYPFVPV